MGLHLEDEAQEVVELHKQIFFDVQHAVDRQGRSCDLSSGVTRRVDCASQLHGRERDGHRQRPSYPQNMSQWHSHDASN